MPDADRPRAGRLWVNSAATPEVVDLVQRELERLFADSPDVAESDRVRFETGLVEVLGNIVEHAFRSDEAAGDTGPEDRRREITVEVEVGETALRAVLRDNGLPAELDLDSVTLPGPEAESGRGLALALATLDTLEHERRDGRNRWTLSCVRRGD